jgi:hypothetical protein
MDVRYHWLVHIPTAFTGPLEHDPTPQEFGNNQLQLYAQVQHDHGTQTLSRGLVQIVLYNAEFFSLLTIRRTTSTRRACSRIHTGTKMTCCVVEIAFFTLCSLLLTSPIQFTSTAERQYQCMGCMCTWVHKCMFGSRPASTLLRIAVLVCIF